MSELFRSENLVVRRVQGQDQDRWIVTFDHYGIGHGFDREGFGEDFLRSRGISAIHVMGRSEDWYQYPDLDDALAAIKASIGNAKRIITYGSSMGGYAAVRLADAVGAHATLALSPQYSIDLSRAPFENRWLQDSQRIKFRPELNGPIRSRARQIIVYDPMTIDRHHAALIHRDSPAQHLRTPFSGHPAGPFLGEIGILEPLVFSVLEGTEKIEEFRETIRVRRGSSAIYSAHLAKAQPPSRRALAIKIARNAVDAKPENVHALEQLARLLSQDQAHEEALAVHQRALAVNHNHYTNQIAYADALIAAGQPNDALKIAREVVSLIETAQMAYLHAWLGLIAWSAGERLEAVEAMQTAVRLYPGNTEYQTLLEDFSRQNDKKETRSDNFIRRTRRALKDRILRKHRKLGPTLNNKAD